MTELRRDWYANKPSPDWPVSKIWLVTKAYRRRLQEHRNISIEDLACWHATTRHMTYRAGHSSPVALNNMNILVRELREGRVVQCDRIRLIDRDCHIRSNLRGVREHTREIGKSVVAELDHIGACVEVDKCIFADVSGKYEGIVPPIP